MAKIPQHKIENYSSSRLKRGVRGIPIVKNSNYEVVEGFTITGDAPKKFIRVFDRNEKPKYFKKNKKKWPLYIAKTGQKWYPLESITEYLLNQLGEVFGLNMAKSSIRVIGGQLRFLSRYFLKNKSEELIHGAEIFAGYVGDLAFIEEIEVEKMARDLFTLQFVEKSVNALFTYQKEDIMHNLVKMLLFDALVGNNDRHFYNWGVIRSINQKFQPYFAPIYDTARGLFWNDNDTKLENHYQNNKIAYVKKYCKNSRPKIGWDGEMNINHFKLVNYIYQSEFYITKEEIKGLFSRYILEQMKDTIDENFSRIMSNTRIEMIKLCIEYRFNEITKLFI